MKYGSLGLKALALGRALAILLLFSGWILLTTLEFEHCSVVEMPLRPFAEKLS